MFMQWQAPWDNCPYGVVSLFDMLEFAAQTYVDIGHQLGLAIGMFQKQGPNVDDWAKVFPKLLDDCNRLGLLVTRDQIARMLLEFIKNDPSKAAIQGEYLHIKETTVDSARFCHHLETINSTLKSELSAITFKAIPKEKSIYCSVNWLTDTVMFAKYPETVDEFQKAGRCFAYGENTACIFHLMRVTEFYLIKVGDSLGVPFNPLNWDSIGKHITKQMEQKYQVKTDDWKAKEPFYAEILSDIQAISRAHRNPALHDLDKKYDEREANNMITIIESFARHVADKL
jgi:hypothetical protein